MHLTAMRVQAAPAALALRLPLLPSPEAPPPRVRGAGHAKNGAPLGPGAAPNPAALAA